MNINIPDKEKISKRRITIYIVSIIICVIALVVVACIIVLGNDFTDGLFGISSIKNKTEQEQRELIDNFDNLFNNGIEISNSELQVTKIDENQDIVYNQYSKQEKSDGNYDLDLNIPYINIDNEIIKGYNQEINDIFVQKAESVYQTEGENIIFKVEYEAFIENNILSLIIRSNLKQGYNPQQDIVQTYNFDLINNKEITLIDEISLLGLDESEVQKRIDNQIAQEQQNAEDLQALGYNIYNRDVNSDMYDIQNSNIFFVHNQNLYVIYAYGNNALTSEMDIIVF